MSSLAILKDVVSACARQAGISISRHPPPGSYARHLKELLELKGVNCVLDVGAFVGSFASALRSSGYNGTIISFEPVPSSYAMLRQRMGHDPHWIGNQYGLSDESCESVLNTYAHGDFNSLLALKTDTEAAYGLDAAHRDRITIRLRRLDEVLPTLLANINSPRLFLKMDTQGHDVNVMMGATGVMEWIVAFQSELPAVQCYEGMPAMSEALQKYATYGFVPIGFYPVNTFHDKQITPEFDVLFNRYDGFLTGH
jgi:FkbM family methyltransferase